jgi:hypothetical protein
MFKEHSRKICIFRYVLLLPSIVFVKTADLSGVHFVVLRLRICGPILSRLHTCHGEIPVTLLITMSVCDKLIKRNC